MREKIIDMLCICFKFQDMECFLNSFFSLSVALWPILKWRSQVMPANIPLNYDQNFFGPFPVESIQRQNLLRHKNE